MLVRDEAREVPSAPGGEFRLGYFSVGKTSSEDAGYRKLPA